MNWRAIRAVVRKDLQVILRSKMVLIPMIVVPMIFLVLFPAVMGAVVNFAPRSISSDLEDLNVMLQRMPPALQAQFNDMAPAQSFLVLMLVYLFAPFFLIVPLMVASVIAADSFAGEKERKTMEALLYTPLTERELLTAKMLSAWIPALGVSVVSFVLYGIVTNLVGWPLMERVFFPNATWLVLVLWVAPAASGLGLGMTVLVSARVRTFQEAYQLGAVVVVPVIALVIGQAAGVIYLSIGLTALLGLILWVIDAVLIWLGVRTFRRGELITQL
jgi:ABC-type Na+ efflux pump permease subunit